MRISPVTLRFPLQTLGRGFIITILLALVSMTVSAIDEYQFHSGTAVLKGRILNKPADEWNIISVRAYDLFTEKELIYNIPVAQDGTFEGSIDLPHSQSVLAMDVSDVFLAVGDTVEVTKDASQDDYEGVVFGGNGTSADINRLWPAVRKHYFGDKRLFINGLAREDIPKWKSDMVKLIDTVIADMEADRLPMPAGTNSYIKEVMGASLLGELLMAFMENYRHNMTEGGNFYNMKVSEFGEYYDFLAGRERWLLDNPAMLLVTKDPLFLINYVGVYIMIDISMMRNKLLLGYHAEDCPSDNDYRTEMVLPHDFNAEQHRRILKMRQDTLFSIADYYRQASQVIKTRYGLKNVGFMQQMVLCQDVFREDRIDENSNPDHVAASFAGAIPLLTNPIVAYHALDRYRQYVKQREGKVTDAGFTTPEADAVFQNVIGPYKGNALYIDFWDMSCAPCRRSMLDERDKVEQLKDLPVRFLYVCDEKTSPRDYAEKWMTENHIKGEHIYLKHEDWLLLCGKFQFNAVPFFLGIDKDGNIASRDAIDRYVDELQNKMSKQDF